MNNTNKKRLNDIVIDNENMAVNVMAGMLEVAQSRGVFNIEESSKIWECVSFLRKTEEKATNDTDMKKEDPNVQMKINEKD